MCTWHLPSTFCVSTGPSVNFPSSRITIHQLPSTFHSSTGPSVNISCIHGIFHVGAGASIKFSQISVRSWHLPSFLNFFMQLPDLPSTSVNFVCICVNFHLLSVCPQIFYQIPSAFCKKVCMAVGSSVNTSQLSVPSQDFPSAFCASARLSINFRQLYMRPRYYLSTFVHPQDLTSTFCASTKHSWNFQCSCQTLCQLLSTFCASVETCIYFLCVRRFSIKFCQLFVHP